MEGKELFEANIQNAGYSGMQVIWDAMVRVFHGEVVLLLGSNGSGKTTFLKSIMGIIEPREGRVSFMGKEITQVPLRIKQSMGISYVSEDTFFQTLTVRENLIMGALHQEKKALQGKLEEVFGIFPEMKERMQDKCSSLSGGQRKMLILAKAIMSSPELLVVDEPSGGLSPLFVDKVLDYMRFLKEKKVSILLSEQNVEFAEIADRIYVMDNGRISFSGTPEEALRDNAIHSAYFNI